MKYHISFDIDCDKDYIDDIEFGLEGLIYYLNSIFESEDSFSAVKLLNRIKYEIINDDDERVDN